MGGDFAMTFTPDEWMLALAFIGMAGVLAIFSASALSAKLRRMKRRKTHRVCRLCGYRFIRKGAFPRCPNCGARNK